VSAEFTANQQILGSILQEKLVFFRKLISNHKIQKHRLLVCRPGKDYKGRGNKKSSDFSELSNLVPHIGELSTLYKEDLRFLFQLKLVLKQHAL